jgi:3-hydroxyacyl-CoA dehydrogenase
MHSLPQAIYMMNKVTQEFLIRPMGIFQLIDYVGIDVFYRICGIMNMYIPNELFQDPLLDKMVKAEIFGGQKADGSQKKGFFQYEGQARRGVYSPMEENYMPISGEHWASACDSELGTFPSGHFSWKKLQRDPLASEKLKNYFFELTQDQTLGAELARHYLIKSKDIAKKLVHTRVAHSMEDVDTVLKNGFYHLYGFKDIDLTISLRC